MSWRRTAAAALMAVVLGATPSRAAEDGEGARPAENAPTVAIPRLEARLAIDGVLDEPAWAQAALLEGFHQFQPVDGRPAEERTEVRVFYTADALCFGVHAFDSQPASVHATMADRDNLDADDTVTIYLDTFNDRRRAFYFTVNPLGAQADGVRTEGSTNPSEISGGDVDSNPDFVFESHGRLTPDGYEVELRVPFKSLRYPAGSQPHTWGLNIERRVRRTGYVDTWTEVRRGSASFLAQSGVIVGMHDLRPGRLFEVQPFGTLIADGRRLDDGSFARGAAQLDGGLNVRVGLSSDTSVDATLNPDFSQVESDVGQVTLNERFALFFPEKRQFFLEGIDLFSTPNRLIYTRRVVDPAFGGKLTLKHGAFNVAHLTAVDENGAPDGVDDRDALLSATRLRRDLGRDSTAGLTFTHRRQGERRNTVAALDARWVFDRVYFLRAQGGGSWTDAGAGRSTRGAPLWLGEFDRTGRRWGFNYAVNAIGRGFDAQAGFVPRTDLVQASAANRIAVYGERGRLVESLTLYHGLTRRWDHSAFELRRPIEEEHSLVGILQLRRGWSVFTQVQRNGYRFDPHAYTSYATLTPEGARPFVLPERLDEAWGVTGMLTLPTFQSFDGSVQVRAGTVPLFPEASRGHESRWDLTLNVRPTASLRVGASLALQYLRRAADGSEFARTLLPRVSVQYQPTRALFFRVIAEYRAERRAALRDPATGQPLLVGGVRAAASDSDQLRIDALISFEPTPGTVAFAGYGAGLADKRDDRFTRLTRVTDGFFVKLAYRFRR